ncbi:alpha/beta hydrolase [Vibrio splendidus]|uniref:alpha/beta hydrolase n=1 Tax=Vibrio splendidus TaxID=29497 RepID=UPI000D3B7298|nr:alpha/beta hydrolase [Vibrio splendidus]MDH5937329.1 alpha/beta hydrolase [Vibrio splendidus]PTO78270.1 alpha/beta hydrolase [Vibrio splendidus]
MKYLIGVCLGALSLSATAQSMVIVDSTRDRSIPIEVVLPQNSDRCTTTEQCNVAFISAGNRVPFTKYSFVGEMLNDRGYMTIYVDHELPSDPPLSKTGDLYKTRIENWTRGAQTLNVLQHELASRFPAYDFNKLTLVGHSNGGDISTWLSNENKNYVSQLITLDHKRVTLPKSESIRVLSIRATEYPTKEGVLPTESEQKQYGSCVVEIPDSKHMDLSDYGSNLAKQSTNDIIIGFLDGLACEELRVKVE